MGEGYWLRLGIKLGLRPSVPQQRALYIRGGTASYLIGNNVKPIRGELKHKETIRRPGIIVS
jgi:hypothetical protein